MNLSEAPTVLKRICPHCGTSHTVKSDKETPCPYCGNRKETLRVQK